MWREKSGNIEPAKPCLEYANALAKLEDGQPGLTVVEHCNIVGQVAKFFTPNEPPASVLAALHDVGKVSPGFQAGKMGLGPAHLADRCETKHAVLSEAAYLRWLEGKEFDAKKWGAALGAHHGTRKKPAPDARGIYGGPDWSAARQKLIDKLVAEFGTPPNIQRGLGFCDLFPDFEPNALQKELHAMAAGRGLYVVVHPVCPC